mgnify:CR=1 FL=1
MRADVAVGRFPGRNGRVVVGLSLLLLIVLLALFASLLQQRMTLAQEALSSIEPRYARLLGLDTVGIDIIQGVDAIGADLARYTYPADSDGQRIGTDLQQRVRRLAEEAGASVVGSQILPARVHGVFAQIPLKVTVNGSLDGIRELLLGFERETPVILVDNLQINAAPRRARRGEAAAPDRLVGQIDLSVLHLK